MVVGLWVEKVGPCRLLSNPFDDFSVVVVVVVVARYQRLAL